MYRLLKAALFSAALLFTHLTFAQSAQFPLVKGFGGIYEVPDATERPDPTLEYKIMVDMSTGADDPKQISRWVDNVARLMNLHGLAGVPQENMHVKVVVHGGAIFTILNNEEYQKRYQVDNPNLPVYQALKDAGVDIYVCGQSMRARSLSKSDISPLIEIAHSALTTITTYVPQGYTLLKF
ncbi:intracellular sulfur oxidation DsrE/DsrF family protein [Algoriphagus iocasae]|uniref:Intracellular sulfur oxidation DsrE/DsrF family protein n=1 Tax=Algoriphagus iocasae TaxID=1836499 RepID=A0A841MT85_9BACT|nr:DsrE family protein [Algoriphagus iocasae]MBB6327326.1 intracellular sulfur oxidation DsrE/DsrF family protein [Algoriphagus iocasae]